MVRSVQTPPTTAPGRPSMRQGPGKLAALVVTAALAVMQGCAALSNPVANGIPVRKLPPELLGESKANLQTIPLSLLRQPRADAYKLAAGDVLGIWIEGVLGEKGQPPPVRVTERETPQGP